MKLQNNRCNRFYFWCHEPGFESFEKIGRRKYKCPLPLHDHLELLQFKQLMVRILKLHATKPLQKKRVQQNYLINFRFFYKNKLKMCIKVLDGNIPIVPDHNHALYSHHLLVLYCNRAHRIQVSYPLWTDHFVASSKTTPEPSLITNMIWPSGSTSTSTTPASLCCYQLPSHNPARQKPLWSHKNTKTQTHASSLSRHPYCTPDKIKLSNASKR